MLQQAQDESELFDDANFAVHDDEVTSDGDEQASTIHRRATEEPLCGTWGCTLANNHFGLHRMPESDQPRKRMKKKQYDEGEPTQPSGSRGGAAKSKALAGATTSPKPKAQPKPRAPAGAAPGSLLAPATCARTPHCQRPAHHPGLCRTPAYCDRNDRCTRGFRHSGVCKVPPQCLKDERCMRPAG
jgi:hypothetical protein